MMKKCPFGKIKCAECELYRVGVRYSDEHPKGIPFEACGINIGIDCLENLVERGIGNQRATEETRNQVKILNELFIGLAQKKLAGIER